MLQCMLFIFTSILNKLIKCNFHAIAIFMVTTLLTMKLQGDGQTMEMNEVAICWLPPHVFAAPYCTYLPPHVMFATPYCVCRPMLCLPPHVVCRPSSIVCLYLVTPALLTFVNGISNYILFLSLKLNEVIPLLMFNILQMSQVLDWNTE